MDMFGLGLYILLLAITIAVVIVLFFTQSYSVVKPHQAHVVVGRKGKRLYMAGREKEGIKSTYFYVPYLMQRSILPLEIIQLKIAGIPLRDVDMAKFSADVIAYVTVEDPLQAAQKLGRIETEETREGFLLMSKELNDLVEAITRNSSMTMDVFKMMRERAQFSQTVEDQIAVQLKDWGLKMNDLEVIHFQDITGGTVIKDLETRQASLISSETRKQVAENEMSAGIVESNSQKDTEIVKAGNEQQFRQKQIEKEKAISIAEQKKVEEVAQAEQVANTKKVDAKRTFDVGIAEIEKQKVIKVAEGDAGARTTRAAAEAEYTQVTGQAEAGIIKAKALAEAEGTEKKAVALKQYNEAGLSLEMIKAQVDIKRAQFSALSEGLKVAKINLVTSGESNILGIPVGAEIGADLGAMLVALQNQGIDITQLLQQLPISETAKLAIAAKAGVEVVKEGTKGKEEPKRR